MSHQGSSLPVPADVLELLERTLALLSGDEFHAFVTRLLKVKFGRSDWRAGPHKDGGIDFLRNDFAVQIYGPERRDISSLRRKVQKYVHALARLREKGAVTQAKGLFLTNANFSAESLADLADWDRSGVEVKNLEDTAAFLAHCYYPYDQLRVYYDRTLVRLREEPWPYSIQPELFVAAVPFGYGPLWSREEPSPGQDPLAFLARALTGTLVCCVGHYGMGKSTLAKQLFLDWHRVIDERDRGARECFPIFVELKHSKVEDFVRGGLQLWIAENLLSTMAEPEALSKSSGGWLWGKDTLLSCVDWMLRTGRLVPIVDSVDEAIYTYNGLKAFISMLFQTVRAAVVTCRREFHPFFDALDELGRLSSQALLLELTDWSEPQWHTYIAGLRKAEPTHAAQVELFEQRLFAGRYGDLSSRPLFIKMLSDLELDKDTPVRIEPPLASNLAEVYHKYIKWKILDDINRKAVLEGGTKLWGPGARGRVDTLFGMLRSLAVKEYEQTLQSPDSSDVTDGLQGRGLTLRLVVDELTRSSFSEEEVAFFQRALVESSLLSILKRLEVSGSTEPIYTFSHKSLMEYLVAFGLAEDVAPEREDSEPGCSEVWLLYQTHVVSLHFLNELERRRYYQGDERVVTKVTQAFGNVVRGVRLGDLLHGYDERIEEVLFYTGWLRLKDEYLVRVLRSIRDAGGNLAGEARVYFRTASVALAMVEGAESAENYVMHLCDDYGRKGVDFRLNCRIQERYYGRGSLRTALYKAIGRYMRGQGDPLISLRLFTYFTAQPIPEQERASFDELLRSVTTQAHRDGAKRLEHVCERIAEICGLGGDHRKQTIG